MALATVYGVFSSYTKNAILFLVLSGVLCSATCKKKSVTPLQEIQISFTKGADISWITEMEAAGKKFYTPTGTETDCFALMKSLGMNAIRLRVWVHPATAWNSIEDVLAKALRVHNQGFKLMIDFHYSDNWADPGKQTKPSAWNLLDFPSLKNALITHTTEVLTRLKNVGITPEWVQIGNEINNGMLWPDGKADIHMQNLSQLVNAGYDASKSVFPNTKVMIHLSDGWNNNLYRWFFGQLKTQGAKWDIIGMSVYPTWYKTSGDWRACNNDVLANMNDMAATYNCDVMVVEAGYPWDRPAEGKLFLQDLIAKVKSVKNQRGTAVFYWEPQCYNNWQGYTLGAFDNSGKPTVALDAFK